MSGSTDNRIVIDAPLDHVWSLTNDVASWPDLFSEYAKAEILDTTGQTVRFRLTMHPDDNGRVWSWVSERTPDPVSRTVLARRVETGPFAHMHIRWDYQEVPGGVEMRWRQDFAMKPDAPLDDAAMTERINRKTVREMGRIKSLVEERAAAGAGSG
ncbi:SRPBCC family protein [Streptomyces sp. NPDC056411]|uniref:SRPBCC family protein n=1 Tax=Streptomyces sp. NPDC056411 TaxID=3345813 RepID=UPI0035D683A6